MSGWVTLGDERVSNVGWLLMSSRVALGGVWQLGYERERLSGVKWVLSGCWLVWSWGFYEVEFISEVRSRWSQTGHSLHPFCPSRITLFRESLVVECAMLYQSEDMWIKSPWISRLQLKTSDSWMSKFIFTTKNFMYSLKSFPKQIVSG